MVELFKHFLRLCAGLLIEIRDILVGIFLSFFKIFVFLPFIIVLSYNFLTRKFFKGEFLIHTPEYGNNKERKGEVIGYIFINGDFNYKISSVREHKTEKLGNFYEFIAEEKTLRMDSISYSKRRKASFFTLLYKRFFK